MNDRKSFILHVDSLDVLEELTDEQRGKLFYSIYKYHKNEKIELEPLIKIAFSQFKNQFKRDEEKYQKIVERNRNNGLQGGRPKNPENPVGSLVTQRNPNKPKKADSVSDNVNDSDNKNEKNKRFTPPTFDEVKNYCEEKNYHIDIQHFIDFYESKGWMVGKNKMKDWKATVRCATKWDSNQEANEQNSSAEQQKLNRLEQAYNSFIETFNTNCQRHRQRKIGDIVEAMSKQNGRKDFSNRLLAELVVKNISLDTLGENVRL